ncbi:MAG: Mur ligase domain-containing protein [Fibrobacter sp.]|nr:Mur ligase domain-containing protein [Fibrobacter sp.]
MNLEPSQSYFFIGIAGVGMSAIAQYLAGKGFSVSGSDRQFGEDSPRIKAQLEQLGIQCFTQDGSGIHAGLSAVVISTAIEETNPDLKKAKELGVPVWHRSEMLAAISNHTKTIAVSGTSGKSTVTAMIFHILTEAGLSPSLMTGASLVSLESQGMIGNAFAGNGEWLVVEADESDGTLVRYKPEIGLILNIDKDHKEIAELQNIFAEFARNLESRGKILIVNDAHPLSKAFSRGREFDFGTESYCGVQGLDFESAGIGIRFRVRHRGELVRFELPFPGKYNMENALAATACALQAGVSLRVCAAALKTFAGVFRRQMFLGTFAGVHLMDDFAHNPAKIAASIESVRSFTSGRVFAWFQPHGFGPAKFLRFDFKKSFLESLHFSGVPEKKDRLYFSKIYYAGGSANQDISAADLAADVNQEGGLAFYIEDRDACAREMVKEARAGDTILLMGARDPSLGAFAESVKRMLEEAASEK